MLNFDRNDESTLSVLNNEATASSTEKRFIMEKQRLEHVLSFSFTLAIIVRVGLREKQLHHNTLHNFVARNQLTIVRNRYTSLSDDATGLSMNILHAGDKSVVQRGFFKNST